MTAVRKPRRLTKRKIAALVAAYGLDKRVEAHLAQPHLASRTRINEQGLGGWIVETDAGPLKVCIGYLFNDDPASRIDGDPWLPGGDTIFCRFENPERIGMLRSSILGVNRYSGKWNHHAFVAYCHGPTDPDDVTAQLEQAFRSFTEGLATFVTLPTGPR